MTRELSRGLARWKYSTGEDAGYLQLDEKTPEALLQLDIVNMILLRRIGGRLWSIPFGERGVVSEIPLFEIIFTNLDGKNGREQYLVGSFSGALSLSQSKYFSKYLVGSINAPHRV